MTSLFLDYALIDFGVGDLPGSISLAHYAEPGKRITGNTGFNGSVNGNPCFAELRPHENGLEDLTSAIQNHRDMVVSASLMLKNNPVFFRGLRLRPDGLW